MELSGTTSPDAGDSLADRIAVAMLTRAFPADVVDGVLADTGRTQMRTRLLPSRVVVYFVLALSLFPGLKYERVARLLSQGLIWSLGRPTTCPVPTAAALSRARARLGAEPLEALFRATAARVAGPPTYRGLRVLSLDTLRIEAPDSEENLAAFGRDPAAGEGPPCLRVAALADESTQAVVDARLGPDAGAGAALTWPLLRALAGNELLLADFGTVGVRSWCVAREHGVELLWAAPADTALSPHAVLPDGSYRCVLDGAGDCAGEEDETGVAVPVRVVECTVAGTPVRLVTSLLDPARAPAAELVELYARRWRFREALADLAAQGPGRARPAAPGGADGGPGRPGPVPMLRSRSASGVRQEVWGHLLVHQAITVLLRGDLPGRGTAAAAAAPRFTAHGQGPQPVRRIV
ncbi:transposase domain-containing protein [Candidatus Protofrankia californiensis]|uniref:transposase domain-containing protein n=1 Tax=Candidatus Protofrankia californiensis TaxID=1839754 RepID=UPI0010414407|nr:transposase domain-containing protein [Candidatus Protofrankia californiensis]